MSAKLRNISLALLAASTLVLAGAVATPLGMFGSQPAFAQGNGGGHGNSGGGNSGNGGGGGNGNAGSHGQSGLGNAYASNAPGQSNGNNGAGDAGTQSNGGVPQSIIRQYVLATGLTQGEVARTLKSWNSLNRNPRAFAATLNSPNSLPALQVAYIRDNMLAQQQLSAFVALGGDPTNPPTTQQFTDASAYLSAEQQLATAGVTAAAVLADPSTYPDLVAAANTVTNYTGPDAQTVVDQYNAWTAYQTAASTATDAFKAASVSYRNADQTTLDALRKLVDDIVTTEGLDTMVSGL